MWGWQNITSPPSLLTHRRCVAWDGPLMADTWLVEAMTTWCVYGPVCKRAALVTRTSLFAAGAIIKEPSRWVTSLEQKKYVISFIVHIDPFMCVHCCCCRLWRGVHGSQISLHLEVVPVIVTSASGMWTAALALVHSTLSPKCVHFDVPGGCLVVVRHLYFYVFSDLITGVCTQLQGARLCTWICPQ